MLELPHVAVGAAIAVKVGNPYLAIPMALVSHFVLDQIPHWNPHFYTETQKYGKPKKESVVFAFIDVGAAFVFGSTVALLALPDVQKTIVIFLASFVSVLPDLIKSPYFFLKLRKDILTKYVHFERSLQADTNIVAGTITQVLVILASVLWMYS